MTKRSEALTPTRRDFCRLAGASLVSILASSCSRSAASAPSKITRNPPNSPVVAVVQRSAHLEAVERALTLIGGLDFVKRGDTVLLKVNTNSGDPYPYSTSPAVLRWLGEQLRDRGARVVVGDRSFWGDDDTRGNLEANGIAAAARAVSATLQVFEPDAVDWVAIPSELVPSWRGPVRVPRIAVDADHIINLPCVKTHFITTCTLSLKNVLGLVHPEDRARPGNLRSHRQDRIYDQIAQINRFVRPSVHLLDGHRALVTGGPTPHSGVGPTIVPAQTIIASRDPRAADALGIALLKTLSPSSEQVTQAATWNNPTLRAAIGHGVGAAASEKMTLRLDRVTAPVELEHFARENPG